MGKDEEGYFLLKAPIGMLLAFGLSMLQSGLIYNVCQLDFEASKCKQATTLP